MRPKTNKKMMNASLWRRRDGSIVGLRAIRRLRTNQPWCGSAGPAKQPIIIQSCQTESTGDIVYKPIFLSYAFHFRDVLLCVRWSKWRLCVRMSAFQGLDIAADDCTRSMLDGKLSQDWEHVWLCDSCNWRFKPVSWDSLSIKLFLLRFVPYWCSCDISDYRFSVFALLIVENDLICTLKGIDQRDY